MATQNKHLYNYHTSKKSLELKSLTMKLLENKKTLSN